MHTDLQAIRTAFATLRRDTGARHRDIAEHLGVSEGEMIAAHAGEASGREGEPVLRATRLRPDWPGIVGALESVGEVMALTRSAHCVHEKVGVYRNAGHDGAVGLAPGGASGLQPSYGAWAHGFAVRERHATGVRRSLQFFDSAGQAIHKVLLRPDSAIPAFEARVAQHALPEQLPGIVAMPAPPRPEPVDDGAVDVAGLREAWAAMRDPGGFVGLLRRFGVTRAQALRLAGERLAWPVAAGSVRWVLESAAASGLPLMVQVGNHGMVQIHAGPVRQVHVTGPWLRVLAPGFGLHLREDRIAGAWVVRRPCDDGIVTSLEVFDSRGETIAMLSGERRPGRPETEAWRALVESQPKELEACAV